MSKFVLATIVSVCASAIGVTGAAAQQARPFSWTGFYVGVNAGLAMGNDVTTRGESVPGPLNRVLSIAFTNVDSSAPTAYSQNPGRDGFVGGAQIGHNWQIASGAIFGLEADIQYAGTSGDARASGRIVQGGAPILFEQNASNEMNWFGTVRGRLGLLIGNDRFLGYVTGGLAYGEVKNSASVVHRSPASGPFGGGISTNVGTSTFECGGTGSVCYSGSAGETSFGWAAGAGFEWALGSNMTLKAEYLHIDLGAQTVKLAPTSAGSNTSGTVRFENSYDIIRAGLNYKF